MGILALMALMPVANVWAGDGDGRTTVISVSGAFTPNTNALTVVLHGKFTQDFVTITPAPGLTVTSVKQEGEIATITLTGNEIQPSGSFGGKEVLDIMTIVGIDNITGVFVDDGGNNGTASGSFRLLDATNEQNTGNKGDGEVHPNRVKVPVSNDKNGPPTNNNNNPTTDGKGGEEGGFSVYPNPVVAETNVVTVGEILGKSLDVVDLGGRRHVSIQLNGAQRSTINLSQLPPGVYMMILNTQDGRSFVQRFCKL